MSVCVYVCRCASIGRPDALTQPPVSRTRQTWDIKHSMPWQGSLSKLGRTVTGVMFWQGIKCLLCRRPVCHSIRLMHIYRWLYDASLWESLAQIYSLANDWSQPRHYEYQTIPYDWVIMNNFQQYISHLYCFMSCSFPGLSFISFL